MQDVRLDTNWLDHTILLTYFVVVLGAEIERAAGVINLWAGLGMLAVSLLFLTWALTRRSARS